MDRDDFIKKLNELPNVLGLGAYKDELIVIHDEIVKTEKEKTWSEAKEMMLEK